MAKRWWFARIVNTSADLAEAPSRHVNTEGGGAGREHPNTTTEKRLDLWTATTAYRTHRSDFTSRMASCLEDCR